MVSYRGYERRGSTSIAEFCVTKAYGRITSAIFQMALLALSTYSDDIHAHSLKERDWREE
jgi:hypothetical protein